MQNQLLDFPKGNGRRKTKTQGQYPIHKSVVFQKPATLKIKLGLTCNRKELEHRLNRHKKE